ncbi:MAG: Holliday junction branch migration protein RuvA [Chlorobi bacterium]|nr:Holliday junction branch migration protein RuvA [Chlorobiota bacterium]
MYEYIEGRLAELTPVHAVVDPGGIGYLLRISMHTYEQLQGKERVRLYTELIVREDGFFLFGFADKEERELFRLLISVSGVGSASAMLILSAMDPARVREAIIGEDVQLLKSVKGIGPKTAKRLIVELKDKLLKAGPAETVTPVSGASPASGDAIAALEALGYPPKTAVPLVRKIIAENPDLTVEQIIKQALNRLIKDKCKTC